MKYKTQEPETAENNSLLELVQIEYNNLSLLTSAKLFCYINGYCDCESFFDKCYNKCKACLFEILAYLYSKTAIFTDNTLPETQYFDSIDDVFETVCEMEEQLFDKKSSIVLEAQENKDAALLAFILPKAQNNHLMCRAHEAVKNKQNPARLIDEVYCPW